MTTPTIGAISWSWPTANGGESGGHLVTRVGGGRWDRTKRVLFNYIIAFHFPPMWPRVVRHAGLENIDRYPDYKTVIIERLLTYLHFTQRKHVNRLTSLDRKQTFKFWGKRTCKQNLLTEGNEFQSKLTCLRFLKPKDKISIVVNKTIQTNPCGKWKWITTYILVNLLKRATRVEIYLSPRHFFAFNANK